MDKIISITPIGFNPKGKEKIFINAKKINPPFDEFLLFDIKENPHRWQIEYEAEADGIKKEEVEIEEIETEEVAEKDKNLIDIIDEKIEVEKKSKSKIKTNKVVKAKTKLLPR